MKSRKELLIAIAALGLPATLSAGRVAYYPMELSQGQVTETVAGKKLMVDAATVAESVRGAKGSAVRFDGYSTTIQNKMSLGELGAFTFSLWCAMETWPIVEHDVQNETDAVCIAGNYDAAAKTGFGFFVSRVGKYSFRFFSQGWAGEVAAPDALPLYKWNNLVAVSDGSNISFYNNGVLLGTTKAKGVSGDGVFMVGKTPGARSLYGFSLDGINGIVDEIEIYDEALALSEIQGWKAECEPDLTAVGEGKYDADIMRPAFHGMPARNWTNETHGLLFHEGKYHLFFQKNANGPYMSRLQWGHLASENLYDWTEFPIALGSDRWFDLKGCWSGCVAVDDEVTGGKPGIIYTGVDYARAMICQASPADDQLLQWTKFPNPIIDGRPSGLSDDFRDPYFFRAGDKAYIIVGSSKDGRGVCTLHEYNSASRTWSNDGRTFFQASNVAAEGSFWEMPNLTAIDGKWLFTATPQGLDAGVKALYWTGSVNADGTFSVSGSSASIELPGFARDGYGLLSPSVMQKDGKTIAIGIVPDKLASQHNYSLGWAHTYSLPREWSLDEAGKLVQKPYSGLQEMRLGSPLASLDKDLDGAESLGSMASRQLEVVGEFTVADSEFGFSFYKGTAGEARLSYSPVSGKLVLDLTSLPRIKNDEQTFNGLYETSLPVAVAKGSVMKLHVFVDHSVMDIFVNDRWASSVRLFPTDESADGVEVFSASGSTKAKVSAWNLGFDRAAVEEVFGLGEASETALVDVYDFCGRLVRSGVERSEAVSSLDPGLYVVGGRKVLVR